ncbi:MAG: glycosyl hydrolase [Candidatus Hydrogenedentota bacterium]
MASAVWGADGDDAWPGALAESNADETDGPLAGSGEAKARAAEPVNPNLDKNARAVFDYLHSIYGKRVLAGMNGDRESAEAFEISGKQPAIRNYDLCGWNDPTWGDAYTRNVQKTMDRAKASWEEGAIVTLTFHWKHPMKSDGSAWVEPPKGSGPFDVGKAITRGTQEHEAVMEDLRRHGDYLQQLKDADVPVLFRPLHEIDGGWFWWTDGETPENTAGLYRLIFDYYVKERKLDNLIWVYNAGLKCAGAGRDVEAIELRKRFYPGDNYVDISGIDIYPNEYFGWPMPQESSYQRAFDIMRQVTPNRILAFSEGGGIPNPDMMAEEGAKWLYCLPWWADHPQNPPAWIEKTFDHPLMITLDELPKW